MVWVLEPDADAVLPKGQLAAADVSAPASSGSSGGSLLSDVPQSLTGSNKQCPSETPTARYLEVGDKSRWYPATFPGYDSSTGKPAQITNLFGRSCVEFKEEANVDVQGHCVGVENCKADYYVDEEGNPQQIEEGDEESLKQLTKPTAGLNTGTVCEGCTPPKPAAGYESAPEYPTRPTAAEVIPASDATKPTEPAAQAPTAPTGQIAAQAPTAQAPASSAGGETPGAQTSAAQRIGNIADSGAAPSKSSGDARGGPPSESGVPRQSFWDSPILSNVANWVFGNGGSGGGSGSAGGSTVRTIAHTPQEPSYYYNKDFGVTVTTMPTFPKPLPSPADIIANLAQNTKRPSVNVTAKDLEGQEGADSFVRTILDNVVAPVGEFVSSAFSSEETLQQESVGEAEEQLPVREEKPPLERGRLILTLSADESTLVPGDPTIVEPINVASEPFESIPSGFAGGESARGASEAIEDIAGTTSSPYVGGDASQSADVEGVSETEEPQISDTPFEPFSPIDGFIPGEGEEGTPPPRSFFSVMGKSFGTIGEAVGTLFTNIGEALFWWL